MNEPFVKTSGTKQKISGIQKAAILLCELGMDTSNEILKILNLTPKETKLLRKTIKSLGPYPRNLNDILREEKVLRETLRFGEVKGIYTPEPELTLQQKLLKENQEGVSKILQENPETITNLIRSWLDN